MIVRIFQEAESFMEVQVRIRNKRRYYASFCKGKIMIIRPAMEELEFFSYLNLRHCSSSLATEREFKRRRIIQNAQVNVIMYFNNNCFFSCINSHI